MFQREKAKRIVSELAKLDNTGLEFLYDSFDFDNYYGVAGSFNVTLRSAVKSTNIANRLRELANNVERNLKESETL